MNHLSPTAEERVLVTVMRKIARRRLIRARAAFALHGSLIIVTLALALPLARWVAAAAASSGFTEYVSLIVSDGARLTGSWYPLALSLAESAPLLGIACALLALVVFLDSLRRMFRDAARLSSFYYSPA